jgi:dolichol-phosphate mannosyltransferase
VSGRLISIIIPTLREAGNLPTLTERIASAISGRAFEIIFVDDDSRDGTEDVCTTLARTFPVRLITRTDTFDGLGGAVLRGINESKGQTLVVMDADLQHPPEKIPELIAAIESGSAEFCVGSRYVPGGTTSEHWSIFRKVNSRFATLLARPFAGSIRDPMSGFFALSRSTFDRGEYLAPLGYKIGLELICKCRASPVVEVPIHFESRRTGHSKLTLKQQFRYLEHLSRLYDFCFPRLTPALKFMIVVSLAWLVCAAVFLPLVGSVPMWAATALGYVGAILTAAMFHARYVRTQKDHFVRPRPWRDFIVSGIVELLTATVVAWFLGRRLQSPTPIELLFIPFACATVVRYILRKEFLLDIRGLRFIPESRTRHLRSR